MARLNQRVEALEQATGKDFKPWVRIMQYADQTEAEAIAVYEAEHGPLNAESQLIIRIVKPVPRPERVECPA